MAWHVALTKAHAEAMAHDLLRKQGFDSLFLHRLRTIRHGRRTRTVKRPLYARYLFVDVGGSQSFYRATMTPGVVAFVSDGNGPLAIPDDVMERERARADSNGLVAPLAPIDHVPLEPGTPVWVIDGAFAGFPGRVTLDTGGEIELLVSLFGRDLPVVLPPDWVTTVSPKVPLLPKIRR